MQIAAWSEVLGPPPAPFTPLTEYPDQSTGTCPMSMASRDKRRDSLFDTPVPDDVPTNVVDHHLLRLPTDVLLLLADHLPPATAVSLRLVCRALHQIIPAPEKPLQDDICARTAIYRHQDERRDAAEGKHRCALCKALYSDYQFRRARIADPELSFTNFATWESVELPHSGNLVSAHSSETGTIQQYTSPIPSTRICAWHINRFIFPPSAALHPDPMFDKLVSAASVSASCAPALEIKIAELGWASSVEPVCMHCGRLVVCVCSVGACNVCTCDCESCGVRRVRCWWKLARVGSGPTRDASFKLARRKWLVARAEEMDRFGWDGMVLNAGGMLDWGLVRAGKCALSMRPHSAPFDKKCSAEEP